MSSDGIRCFSLANHVAHAARQDILPWEYQPQVPEHASRSKQDFKEWCSKPDTRHCMFSLVEGVQPGVRVNNENPLVSVHGVIVDYECYHYTETDRQRVHENPGAAYLPNYLSNSFSGGLHAVWLFERPVCVMNQYHYAAFIERLYKKLKFSKLATDPDMAALRRPQTYYEVGSNWQMLTGDRIPDELVKHELFNAAVELDRVPGEDISVPMEVLAMEIEKRWSGRWPTVFEPGARGPRFWDPNADNDTAAVMMPTGMCCYTGPVGFMSWRQIFSPDNKFIDKYEGLKSSSIISKMAYDGKTYYMLKDKKWISHSAVDAARELSISYDIKTTGKKLKTEIDRLLVRMNKPGVSRIEGAGKYIHREYGPIIINGKCHLNLLVDKLMQPLPGEALKWGEGFTQTAKFFDSFFAHPEHTQRSLFLAWLKYAYIHALKHKPLQGQILFLIGDTGIGKTYCSHEIIAKILGGMVDGSKYLVGDDQFTETYFSEPVITVDDAVSVSDHRAKYRYTEKLKALSANNWAISNQKFQKSEQIHWAGRVVVTCNDDYRSLDMLPELTPSNLDKLIILRCKQSDITDLRNAGIGPELPALCRFLLGWTPPAEIVGPEFERFGVRDYTQPQLKDESNNRSSGSQFRQLLLAYLDFYRHTVRPGAEVWEGAVHQLFAAMRKYDEIQASMFGYGDDIIRRHLEYFIQLGYNITKSRDPRGMDKYHIPINLSVPMVDTSFELSEDREEDVIVE